MKDEAFAERFLGRYLDKCGPMYTSVAFDELENFDDTLRNVTMTNWFVANLRPDQPDMFKVPGALLRLTREFAEAMGFDPDKMEKA